MTLPHASTFHSAIIRPTNRKKGMLLNHFMLCLAANLLTWSSAAPAADVTMQLAPSGNFIVKDTTGTNELVHLNEGGSVSMGFGSTAAGAFSMAMGNSANADGILSTALGSYVSNGKFTGSFIWGDNGHTSASHTNVASNTANNQFMVVASGGVIFYSSPGLNEGVEVASGNNAWTTVSDRNAKTAVVPVDSRTVLEKIVAMPLNTWQYKTQEAQYRHMGPMAQDFYAAFHLGESDKGIDTVDADGVALAAIQGLNAKLTEKIAAKDAEIAGLRTELATLRTAMIDLAEIKRQLATLRQPDPAARGVDIAMRSSSTFDP